MKKGIFLLFLATTFGPGLMCFFIFINPSDFAETFDWEVDGPLVPALSQLETKGILPWPGGLLIRAGLRWYGLERKVKQGTYRLPPHTVPLDLLEMLVQGKTFEVHGVFPEGWNRWQVKGKLISLFPQIPPTQWEQTWQEPSLLAQLPQGATSLEGYLFPQHYTFRPKAKPKDILGAMVSQFKKTFTPELQAKGKALGLSPHGIVTLASIIEKETGRPEERRHISAVFHNRLKKKMRLQTDPTVIYGLGENFNGNITKKNLRAPTPYNTYVIMGMPPGPIANPGRSALEAAVDPEDSADLFFVSKGDGTHVFSKTLMEHNKWVVRYQIKKSAPQTKPNGKPTK